MGHEAGRPDGCGAGVGHAVDVGAVLNQDLDDLKVDIIGIIDDQNLDMWFQTSN